MLLHYLGGTGALHEGGRGIRVRQEHRTRKAEVRVRLGQDGGREPASQGPRELETQRKWSQNTVLLAL